MGTRTGWGGRISILCGLSVFLLPVQAAEDRRVHRFLEVEISPDGTWVAAVEGDSPVNGIYPSLRELVIRRVGTGAETSISLACGHVPECWPGSPTWSSDSKHLSFTLRKPGSHSYSVYTV